MNTKTKILTYLTASALFLTGLALFNTGCRTVITNNPDGTSTTNKVADVTTVTNTINIVVPLAVQVAVGANSNSVVYLNAAVVTIDLLVQAGSYDPVRLEELLNNLGSERLRTPEAKAAIQAGLGLYKAFVADSIKLETDKIDYGAVLSAFSNSIKVGLASPPIVLKTE